MRGIERLVAGALLVMAVTGTAVLARTSAPGGHAQTLRLQSPPRSHLVAPLPVFIAVPEAPPRLVVTQRATLRPPAVPVFVAASKPVEVPTVTPPAPASPPSPTPKPPAAAPAPPPAPTPPAPPTTATRVVAAAQ